MWRAFMHWAGLCRQCRSTGSGVHCYDHNPSLRPLNQPAWSCGAPASQPIQSQWYCTETNACIGQRPYCSASGVHAKCTRECHMNRSRYKVRDTVRIRYKVRGTVRTKYKVRGTRGTGYKVRGTCCIRFSASCPFGTECWVFFWYHFRGSPVITPHGPPTK